MDRDTAMVGKSDVRANCQHLARLLGLMGAYNGMTAVEKWPTHKDLNYSKLDKQAALLTREEAETFVDGENTETEQIVLKYQIQALHNFLNSAFNGYLNRFFYED